MNRLVAAGILLLSVAAFPAGAHGTHVDCDARLLVLSAFPGEIEMLLAEAVVEEIVTIDERSFFEGSLRGNEVTLGLTGIGLNNARRTTEAALSRYDCESGGVTGIVFSGVSGGQTDIGDVTIPAAWTDTVDETEFPVDPTMFATAESAVEAGGIELASETPVGDPACVGVNAQATTVTIEAPEIIVGGIGRSADPFGGRTLPCFPGGGDVFGCAPCRYPVQDAPDAERAATGALPFIDPAFFFGYFEQQPSVGDAAAADMETGAVARVAAANDIPFIAFRALSDGEGDPLNLPGFPFQFFYYRQLAADNAATVTLAFLEAWAAG